MQEYWLDEEDSKRGKKGNLYRVEYGPSKATSTPGGSSERVPDHSKSMISGLGSIHCDGVSWIAPDD